MSKYVFRIDDDQQVIVVRSTNYHSAVAKVEIMLENDDFLSTDKKLKSLRMISVEDLEDE